MKETKSILQKNLVLIVALGVLALMILFFATSKTSAVPSLSLSDASAASQPVYRFWSDPYQSHFYTISEFERDYVSRNDKNWIFEGVVFHAFDKKQPNTTPIYRFWNTTQKSHFYTQSTLERDKVRGESQWRYEGIAYHTLAKVTGASPVYRLYSPSRKAHYYAQLTSEKDALIAQGDWDFEGVAFYSKKVSVSPVNPVVPDNPVNPVVPPTPINGSCGSDNGSTFDTAPTSQLCGSGSASSVSGSGPWSWSCQGSNGGSTAQCSAQKKAAAPTQCADGIDNDGDGVTDLADTDCTNANDDTESGTTPLNGQCGTANTTTAASIPPSTDLCTNGTVQNQITAGDKFTWNCQGANGGTADSCQMTLTTVTPINGQCGSSDGQTVTTAPTTNLCNTGSPTSLSGAGPWSWSCNGSGGGTNSSCSAQKTVAPTPVNGQCGSSDGQTVTTAPTTNLCNTGSPTGVSGDGPWSWSCNGTGGGTNISCVAQKTVAASPNCGIDHGQTLTGPPQNDLCANGLTPADETGSGPWLWTCRDGGGELVATCRAEREGDTGDTQGVCGATVNSCDVGDFIDTDDSSTQHLWGCIGSGGFATFADCSLDK